MRKSNIVTISSLACAVVAALACGQAMASGFQIREDSIQAMARSHAGSASDWGDAAVVANNPAAMSLFDKTTFQSDLTAIDLHGTFVGGGANALPPPGNTLLTGGNGGDVGDTTPVPAVHFILPVGNGFTIGASLTAPFGLRTQYDPNWVGRYFALKSELKTVDFTLAGSYKINDMFSVGASLIYQRADAELSNAVDFGKLLYLKGAGPLGFFPQSADGTARIKGNDSSFGWDVGFLFRPTPDTNIGLNFRSKIDHNISGHADFNVPSNVRAVLGAAPLFLNTPAAADISTPSVWTFSVSQKFAQDFTLSADVERTNWNTLKGLTVTFANPAQPTSFEAFNWKNSTEYALGLDWRIDPHWTLRGGIARDNTPTNDGTRDPRLPDNNRQLYSVGLGWMPNDNVSWNIGYTRINIDTPKIVDVNLQSSPGAVLAGQYNADANLFGVSATFHF